MRELFLLLAIMALVMLGSAYMLEQKLKSIAIERNV